MQSLTWLKGDTDRYIRSEDGRFYICKSGAAGGWVYTLADGNELVCSYQGADALQRCKAKAEELAK